MRFRALAVLVGLTAAAACGSSTSTSPTIPFTTSSQFFVGTLNPGGSASYTLGVSPQSFVAVTFASAVADSTGLPIDGTLELGLGTPSGATCAPATTRNVSVALAAQIIAQEQPGNYCVRVRDTGALTGPTVFAVRITTTSTEPPTTSNSFVDSFTSQIPVGGATSHTFDARRGGTATITLSSAAADKVYRLALGLWDGTVCRLNSFVDTTSGSEPQIVSGVDAGTYCVTLRDVNASGRTNFSISIARPQ